MLNIGSVSITIEETIAKLSKMIDIFYTKQTAVSVEDSSISNKKRASTFVCTKTIYSNMTVITQFPD